MQDKREEILIRLEALFQGLAGITLAGRNILLPDERQRPCLILLDADEVAAQSAQVPGRRSPGGAALISMTPEVWLILSGKAALVGPQINALRLTIIRAVLFDTALNDICGPNGGITYEGCATGLARARNLEAEMGLSFTFTYPLQPIIPT